MSRLPPLPPGLPPKPLSDSYRPGVPLHENYFARQDRQDRPDRQEKGRDQLPQSMYQFGNRSDPRDSHRHRSPPRYNYDNYGPPGVHKAPSRPAADVYRPQGSQFTFRYDAPQSIASRQSDTWRPASPARQQDYTQDNGNSFRNNHHLDRQQYQRNGGQRSAHGYRGRGGPRMASDREFLKGNRAPTPELMPGMDQDDTKGVKYKRAEDMSDSEEEEMDMSDEEDGDGQPARKRARTETTAADNNVTHQWSNPDPYTALPPPDESQRKKKDVVKLIRKARVGPGSGTKVKPETAPDDFISLDFGAESDDKADFAPERSGKGVAGAPSGPKALLQPRQALSTAKTISFSGHLNDISNTYPKTRDVSDLTRDDSLGDRKRNAYDEVIARPSVLDTRLDPNLGSRKRTARDEIINPPPMIYKTTRGKPPSVDGNVLKEWLVPRGETGTPWLISDHSDTAGMGVW